jgi:hypothetical protein
VTAYFSFFGFYRRQFACPMRSCGATAGGIEVLISAYGSNALRTLTSTLSEALAVLDKSTARAMNGAEKAHFRNSVARNLMDAYDCGERDPKALNQLGLRGLFVAHLSR